MDGGQGHKRGKSWDCPQAARDPVPPHQNPPKVTVTSQKANPLGCGHPRERAQAGVRVGVEWEGGLHRGTHIHLAPPPPMPTLQAEVKVSQLTASCPQPQQVALCPHHPPPFQMSKGTWGTWVQASFTCWTICSCHSQLRAF